MQCFIHPIHIALVFFLFNLSPERIPNHSIIRRFDLRDSVLLLTMVVSSANCEILALSSCNESSLIGVD